MLTIIEGRVTMLHLFVTSFVLGIFEQKLFFFLQMTSENFPSTSHITVLGECCINRVNSSVLADVIFFFKYIYFLDFIT